MTALLITNLTATLFLTGIAWSLQFVQLPMLTEENAARHRRRNTRLVIVPMIVEAVASAALLVPSPTTPIVAAFLLWCGVAIGTAGYTLAHSRRALHQLATWNLLRAACWSCRAILLIILLGARF